MRFSIRLQLLLPLAPLILGVVGIGAWTAWSSAARARKQIEHDMDAVAATARKVVFPRNADMLKLIKGLSGPDLLLADQAYQALRDRNGEPIMTLPALPAELPRSGADVESGLGVPVEVAGEAYFCRSVSLGEGGAQPLILFQFYPEAQYREAVWEAVRPGLVLGVVGGAASILLTIILTNRLARRFQELERRTRLIAGGDFSPMTLPKRNDELRDLAGSINDMAEQLARYQEKMVLTERLRLLGQVSGGLAHQLRNGVTGARLAVQLHARECDQAKDGETLEVALRQLALVELHLKRFLELGRSAPFTRGACDLMAVLRETMLLLGPQARHARTDLRWRRGTATDQDLIMKGDVEQLRHLFLNVLTNAMEAAGPEGWVEVHAAPEADRIIVEVSDSGPGPGQEVAAKLFEPFITGKPEGVGLGLAVARQVAQGHGGNISWSRGEATCFRVELPYETE